MRINGDRSSPDYWPLHFARLPIVRLDGKEIIGALMADDRAGIVEVTAMRADGAPALDAEGLPFRRMLAGKVEIIGPALDEAMN
jgi:hypothetical protein